MRFFSFSFLLASGALLGHLYLYFRLVRPLTSSRTARAWLGALLAVATLLVVFRKPIRALHPGVEAVLEQVIFGWMAFGIGMVLATFAGDLVRAGLAAARFGSARSATRADDAREDEAREDEAREDEAREDDAAPDEARTGSEGSDTHERSASTPPKARGDAPADPARRALVTRALPWAVLSAGGLTAGSGTLRAFTPPEVSELAVRLPRLPRTLEGLSIVQLTDIHVGPFVGRRFIDALVAEANALRPDVMVITGDLVDGDVRTLGHAVEGLANLRARYGTYFVTGNHEYYSGELAWVRFLESIGITVLRNQRVPIGDGGGHIDLVGVDDWSGARSRGGQGYDLDAALDGRDPERAAVLLAHQPAHFEVAAQRGIGLQISGHTHGGQIFPATLLVGLQHRYTRGLYREGDSHIYVSRGCGFWGPPSRIGSPPSS